MIEITKNKKNYIIKSDCYSLNINNSGTIRRLFFNGINTGLKREGCEYWKEDGLHFQQEFGGILQFEQKRNRIEVTATLKSAKNKRGGKCITKYNFKKDSIVIESEISPACAMFSYDKYVCFNPKEYTYYSFNGKDFNEIDKDRFVDADTKSITLSTGDKAIVINCLSGISEMRVYKTKSMIEIKPNWIDPIMKIEYKVYGLPKKEITVDELPATRKEIISD